MKEKPLHQKWLDRSRSNLERARVDSFSRNIHILYEDMCFDCQQSVEKALKGLMVFKNIEFEWTHDIGTLIKTLEDNSVEVPDKIKKSASLSVYAVRTRYPGEEEPVTKQDFQEALNLADNVFEWVKNKLEAPPPEPHDEKETDKTIKRVGEEIQKTAEENKE
jgi:HEPN domain-containing protein